MKRFSKCVLLMIFVLIAMVALSACGHEHQFGPWEQEKNPSCTTQGQKIRYCACGEEQSKNIPAKGHTEGEWVTVEDATCTVDGSRKLVCADCGETMKTETLPSRGGHQYTDTILTESSCTTQGVKKFTCSVCQDSYTEKFDHPIYTATEIYDMYLNSVGEITVYNKNGQALSLGTGFVYSADGKIITNYHVIEDGYSAEITLGGKTYKIQKVLAYDKNIDLAVLKINATGLPAVKLCKTSHKVGEKVYAFGSSQGLTATFSDGMITTSCREVEGVKHVQHDAPISSGNSGGPLINNYGEVIGVNTWTLLDSQNLNFAILVSEFDNLNYSNPMTMAQFYEKECNVFLKLKNYILNNGDYDSDGYYYVILGTYESDDTYTHVAYYYPSDGIITLDMLIESDNEDYWAYITIDENISGVYKWNYFDDSYKMNGTLYANTFTEDSLLSISYCNTSIAALKSAIQKLASTMVSLICTGVDAYLDDIGITVADLGFTRFKS